MSDVANDVEHIASTGDEGMPDKRGRARAPPLASQPTRVTNLIRGSNRARSRHFRDRSCHDRLRSLLTEMSESDIPRVLELQSVLEESQSGSDMSRCLLEILFLSLAIETSFRVIESDNVLGLSPLMSTFLSEERGLSISFWEAK